MLSRLDAVSMNGHCKLVQHVSGYMGWLQCQCPTKPRWGVIPNQSMSDGVGVWCYCSKVWVPSNQCSSYDSSFFDAHCNDFVFDGKDQSAFGGNYHSFFDGNYHSLFDDNYHSVSVTHIAVSSILQPRLMGIRDRAQFLKADQLEFPIGYCVCHCGRDGCCRR